MTLAAFKTLSEDERYMVWLAKAIQVAAYENNFYIFKLYQLHSFYIEIRTFKLFPANDRWAAFSGEEYLEPYLKEIDINPLIIQ